MAKKTAEANTKEVEVTKIDANNFEVKETVVSSRKVEKGELKKQIAEIEGVITRVRQDTGLDAMEADLAVKKDLLSQLK